MRHLLVIVALLGVYSSSCTKKEDGKITNELIVQESDTTIYIKALDFEAVIFKPTYKWKSLGTDIDSIKNPILLAIPENKDAQPWSPTVESVFSFDSTFRQYWKAAKTDSLARINSKVIMPYLNLQGIQYQHIGFIDSIGGKKSWVNLIFNWENSDWKEQPILIEGTGLFKRSFFYDVERDSITKVFIY